MAGVGRPPQRPPRGSPPPVPQHSARSPERLFELLERGVDRALRPASARGQAPRNASTGDFRRGMTTADEAYAAYNEALAVSAGREVAVYYNYLTGEYRVRIGTYTKVFGPADDGDWGALVHFHPNPFNALGYRLPAPADFFGLYMRFFREGRHVREFVETDIPGVGRGRTEFGIEGAPRKPVLYVRFHHPDGRPPTTRKFSGDGEYQRYWSERTVYVEKGSPEHVEILADQGAGRRSHRGTGTRTQTGGGSRDFDHEDPTPPANPRRQGKVHKPDFDEEADTIVDHPDSAHQSGEIRVPDKSTDRPVTPEPKVIVDPEITDPRSSLSIPPEFQMVDEVIGDYHVRGSRALDGNVLRRRILMLQQRHGKAREGGAGDAGRVPPSLRDVIRPINHFLELLLADAAAAGATRLEILGMAVQAASVRNIRLAVKRYGGTVTRISDTSINIEIPVTGSAPTL
jgi:hypothetical protein